MEFVIPDLDVQLILKTMYIVCMLMLIAATLFVWQHRAYLPKIVHDCLTGPDGETYDPARVIGYPIILVTAFIIICMNIYNGMQGKWDGNAFVTQIGGLLLAHLGQSAAVLIKGNQEPKAPVVPTEPTTPISTPGTPTSPPIPVAPHAVPVAPVVAAAPIAKAPVEPVVTTVVEEEPPITDPVPEVVEKPVKGSTRVKTIPKPPKNK